MLIQKYYATSDMEVGGMSAEVEPSCQELIFYLIIGS